MLSTICHVPLFGLIEDKQDYVRTGKTATSECTSRRRLGRNVARHTDHLTAGFSEPFVDLILKGGDFTFNAFKDLELLHDNFLWTVGVSVAVILTNRQAACQGFGFAFGGVWTGPKAMDVWMG